MIQPPISPIPIPTGDLARCRTLLVVGGSFDPPHLGHVRIPAALRASTFPDGPCSDAVWLVYVPAARSPLKTAGPVASDADRVAMLRLAIAGLAHACVWTDEVDRAAHDPSAPPSFTIDTLRRARAWLDQHAPHTTLRLVIGADQAASFHKWREPEQIIALAEPLVMGRKGVAQEEQILRAIHSAGVWTPEQIAQWRPRIHDLREQGIELSSTQIRELLARGGDASAFLAPGVGAYIAQHAIYAR